RPPVPVPPTPGPKAVSVNTETANMVRRYLLMEEFLTPSEMQSLMQFALSKEHDFVPSEVVSTEQNEGVLDFQYRRSKVLYELDSFEKIIPSRLQARLPGILAPLGIPQFPVVGVETQITSSNDGDCFRSHTDNSQPAVASRRLTFVYFFHK